MNKKILISLSVIAAVAAIAIGGTIAYFSDTETSTGNLFAAGAIDLKIDNECYLNGEPVGGCSWELKDLDGELFFNFSDLKPGDWGEDTVSLHVYSNDAWGCVTFDNMVDYDNDCTEPEAEDGDQSCGNPGPDEGELSDELYFVFWADVCKRLGANYPVVIPPALPGDNVFQPECDYLLMEGYASDILPGTTYTLAAPGEDNVFTGEPGEPLTGSEDYYIGKVWCFGELYWDGEWTCDGEPVDNMSQTDSLTGDIIFYAEQSRNNSNFTCVQPTRYLSSMMNYSGTGWGGVSCPGSEYAVGGGVESDGGLPLGAQGIAQTGAVIGGETYPNFPHYTFPSGETGYVLQNGGNGGGGQTIQLYVDCLPKP